MREPADSDRGLIDAAREGLFEITDEETVGAVVGVDDSVDGVVDVFFASTMAGYPDWRWNVSVSTIEGAEAPSILEAELLPGEGSLLSPDWVPWADRLADYRAAQADAVTGDGEDSDLDDDDDDDDSDDLDDDDDDVDGDDVDLLDADDEIDGVDFESPDIDDDSDDDDSDDDDESEDDESDDDESDGDASDDDSDDDSDDADAPRGRSRRRR